MGSSGAFCSRAPVDETDGRRSLPRGYQTAMPPTHQPATVTSAFLRKRNGISFTGMAQLEFQQRTFELNVTQQVCLYQQEVRDEKVRSVSAAIFG